MSENSQNKSELKSFKDIDSVDELDLNKIELVRGDTPPDIESKCLQLCKDYLSGNWCQQTVDTIEVRRITGGLINQLYYCGIKQPGNNNNVSVPQEVAIKFYGENLLGSIENSRTRDVVIALTFSKNNLGPKIYGLFEEGQIQKFYKHRQFKEEEQRIPAIRERVFKTLAQIHSLDVPIKKDPNFMFDLMLKWYQEAFDKFPIVEEMNEYKCELMKACDLKGEIDFVINIAQSCGSPALFTHNDFRSSNLLITEPNDQLIVCDYDLTGYGYRGYDFVSLSREWGRNQFDTTPVRGIPFNEDEYKSLIEIYVEECEQIYGKSYSENPINSVEHILKEVKIFLLFAALFGAVFVLKNDEAQGDFPFSRKLCLEMTEKSIDYYNSIKKKLKEQNII